MEVLIIRAEGLRAEPVLARSSASHLSKAFQITRHTKEPLSVLDILNIEDQYPELWNALCEIPAQILIPRANGIYLQPSVYIGLKRNGPNYIEWRIREDKIELSHKAMQILRLVSRHQKFITWDRLLEYLRDHNWGKLEPDKMRFISVV